MATIITNYTTYDLVYYYADLRRLPRLSREERQHLVTGMSESTTSPALSQDDSQVKQRLIEGYLPFAKHLAITLCPSTLYQRLLPELIGAVNLAVVEAVMRWDLASTLSLDAYAAAYVRGAIKHTIVKDDVFPIPFRARERARAEGTLDQLYTQHRVASLDEHMEWFDTDEVEEPPVKPILPIEAAPARDLVLRAQVDTLLSYLSPRAQAILRLRFGLADDNERSHTTNEIAAPLGIDRRVVLTIERDALTRLRAFVAGKAALGQKNGKCCICYPDAHNTSANTQEQEAALLAAYDDLETRDIIVTGRSLASAAGTSVERAWTFLRRHRPGTPTEARARQRQQKLARVCARLEARGVRVTSPLLAREAGVAKKTAIDFLLHEGARVMPQLNPGSWKLGLQRARLTLHESDPITGNEDILSSLFYEFYRGYTIYSTPRGRSCIHGQQGCLKLLGRFVCFYDVGEAKTFIKHLRRAGYRAADPAERYLPPETYVWLNCWTLPRQHRAVRPVQSVS